MIRSMFWILLTIRLVTSIVGCAGPSHDLCLTVLDVGQGDALLLSLPGGEQWLIDGGADLRGDNLVGALRRAGARRLERVVLTHGHLDHAGGLHAVLAELDVGGLWVGDTDDDPEVLALVGRARALGVAVHGWPKEPFPPAPAPTEVQVLHPLAGWKPPGSGDPENNGSIVLRVRLGEVPFLLPGDAEGEVEEALLSQAGSLRSVVLKAPHHLSRTSSTEALLAAVDPVIAVAGVGAENSYGFPHASVMSRYLRRGVTVRWTGRHGPIRTCTDGFDLRLLLGEPRGRWRLERRWSPEDLRPWAARKGPAAPPTGWGVPTTFPPARGIEDDDRPPRRRRVAKKAPGPRRRPTRWRDESSEPPERPPRAPRPVPTPPPPAPLLDDKEWAASRKDRAAAPKVRQR